VPENRATVLVFEENAALQELIDQALRDDGHRVLTTKNSFEALELARRVRIDVLVAGDVLEEGHKDAFVGQLRSVQPELGVVAIRSRGVDLPNGDPSTSLPVPFALDNLLAAVAEQARS
jgi:DNA-binding NtrC family response regulator